MLSHRPGSSHGSSLPPPPRPWWCDEATYNQILGVHLPAMMPLADWVRLALRLRAPIDRVLTSEALDVDPPNLSDPARAAAVAAQAEAYRERRQVPVLVEYATPTRPRPARTPIERIARRVRSLDRSTAAAFAAVGDRLASIERQLARMGGAA